MLEYYVSDEEYARRYGVSSQWVWDDRIKVKKVKEVK